MQLNPQDLSWCVKRLPRDLMKLLKEHAGRVFLAGGYIRSRITQENVNDIDLFVPNEAMAHIVASQYAGHDENRVHKTQNAFTVKGTRPTVQVIHRWTFENPIDVLKSFDFTIACAAIWWNGEKWESACHADYYSDLAGKRLVYLSPVRNEDAGGSILRVLKFYQRGYRIPLDSMGAVIARLMMGVKMDEVDSHGSENREPQLAKVLTGLLREVDPNIDPDHTAHLPSATGIDPETQTSDDLPW